MSEYASEDMKNMHIWQMVRPLTLDPMDYIPVSIPLEKEGLKKKKNRKHQPKLFPGLENFLVEPIQKPKISKTTIRLLEEDTDPLEMSGFNILDSANTNDPEVVMSVNVSGNRFASIRAEDMVYFKKLNSINASENNLTLSHFNCFPSVQEIMLENNHITSLGEISEKLAFNLHRLDLGYNDLSPTSIKPLANCPNLLSLNLMGNRITKIPKTFVNLASLEVLILSRNGIRNDTGLNTLSKMKKLKQLYLDHNELTTLGNIFGPVDNKLNIETLDISYNYFENEMSMSSCLILTKLTRLVITGNPILKHSYDLSSIYNNTDNYLNIITGMEKKKNETPMLGYTDFSITKIPEASILATNKPRSPSPISTPNSIKHHSRKIKSAPINQEIQQQQQDIKENNVRGGDGVFLTEAIFDEDYNSGNIYPPTQQQQYPTESRNSLIPSTIIGTSTAKKPKQDPSLLRSAITALRFMLSHPLTSDNDHLHFNKPPQYCKLNFITRARQKKHVEPPKPTQKFTRRLKSQKEIDKILDNVYNDESDESDDEQGMKALSKLVDKVVETYKSSN